MGRQHCNLLITKPPLSSLPRTFLSLFAACFQALILIDYYHGNQVGLAAIAGQLGATYAIPIIYVPLLMITHVAAFYLLARPQLKSAHTLAGDAAL